MKTQLHYLIFPFIGLLLIFIRPCFGQDKSQIRILNEKGEKPKTGERQLYLYFNNNEIKRKIEEGERVFLSVSGKIAAITQSKNRYDLMDIFIYNNKGNLTKKIHDDSIATGGLDISNDGQLAYFKPVFIDELGSAPVRIIFYSKDANKITEYNELISPIFRSIFSENGNFAVFSAMDLQNTKNAQLILFDSLFHVTGLYTYQNFNNKTINITQDALKFDSDENVIISSYDLSEFEDSKKNKLIKYRLVIDLKGNFIKKMEGWENE